MLHNSGSSGVKQTSCSSCGKNHFIADCEEFSQQSVDDKWKFVMEKKLCFSCLSVGHSVRTCHRKKFCNIDGCKRAHHPKLHNELRLQVGRQESTESTSHTLVNRHAASIAAKVLFKMIPVNIYNSDKVITTYALLDEGSSISLIDKDLAQRLGLSGSKRRLNLQWFGNHSSSEDSEMVKFEISGVHHSAESFEMNNVCTVDTLGLPMQTINVNELLEKYHYLRNLPIRSYTNAKPELLIGLDYCYLGISRRKIRHASNGPIVAEHLDGSCMEEVTRHPLIRTPYECFMPMKDLTNWILW